MKIERIWAMPNKNTFDIPPIKTLLTEEMGGGVVLCGSTRSRTVQDWQKSPMT